MGPKQLISLQIRVDLRVMVMRKYYKLSKCPRVEPHHRMQFSFIFRTLLFGERGYSPQFRWIQCIINHATALFFILVRYNKMLYFSIKYFVWVHRSTLLMSSSLFLQQCPVWSYGNQTWPIKWNAVSFRQRSCWYCCMDAPLGH